MDEADRPKNNHIKSIEALPLGWSIDFSDTAPSSNDLALAALKTHGRAAAGSCFVVGEQTKGRGRLGREWTSRPGDGLYLSAILCPEAPLNLWPSLSFAISLAVYRLLAEQIDEKAADISLKWPNDVLVNGGKIAGILLEAEAGGVVAGCGINLKNAPINPSQKHQAVSLDGFSGHHAMLSARELAFRLVHHVAECYEDWQDKGHQAIIEQWQHHCNMIGQPVRIQTPAGLAEGICTAIGQDGQLVVRDATGQEIFITAGDVEIMKGQA